MEQQSLWAKISKIEFDGEGDVFPFSHRLARDNGWSHSYTHRVIEEYRRFVYLAMVAGHEVTPSDEVDQVWHLHLTYTRHYWGAFTAILGAPLHHGPTRGGNSEKMRYTDNYAETLTSYAREFDAPAPRDIWPSSKVRFGDAPKMRRINMRKQIVLLRTSTQLGIGTLIGGTAIATLAAAADTSAASGGFAQMFAENKSLFLVFFLLAGMTTLYSVGRTISQQLAAKKSKGAGIDGGVGGTSGGKGVGDDGGGGDASGCGGCGG